MRRWLKYQWASATVAIIWLGQATTAMAKETEAADSGGKTSVLGYALTVMLIALGLAVVCRGGHRAEKPKMVEQDLEQKLKKMSA